MFTSNLSYSKLLPEPCSPDPAPWQSDVHSQQRFFCQMQTAEVTVDQAGDLRLKFRCLTAEAKNIWSRPIKPKL